MHSRKATRSQNAWQSRENEIPNIKEEPYLNCSVMTVDSCSNRRGLWCYVLPVFCFILLVVSSCVMLRFMSCLNLFLSFALLQLFYVTMISLVTSVSSTNRFLSLVCFCSCSSCPLLALCAMKSCFNLVYVEQSAFILHVFVWKTGIVPHPDARGPSHFASKVLVKISAFFPV